MAGLDPAWNTLKNKFMKVQDRILIAQAQDMFLFLGNLLCMIQWDYD